ncbi:hypothetical protein [Lactococcus lactis]|uniref:Uncharacterized protein n=1 Tax=Lactococcus lactis subsp. lactis TaxID=1360 RepID=A0A2N5WAQ3_LACLL|nr:hypothetical protein [Lactococcus lactis]MBU5242837.1 hypothetical protein [Lactococcus lactis]MDT2856691.1 hypothetical protein [Lactococcus lactis]PLW59298.1 hypothetical protein CYU10_000148 [Lactococcus lactis subsp. lactis]
MTDSNIEKTLINGEIEHLKHVRKRNCTTKTPKMYGKFKDGSIVELEDIKSSGVGFNGYTPYYRVLAAINREEGRDEEG